MENLKSFKESFKGDSIRYKTMDLKKIDADDIGSMVCKEWKEVNEARDDFLQKRENYTSYWRDLNEQSTQGAWENSSNFRHPLVLIYGKAIHAKLWQMFTNFRDFFGVRSRKEAFEDKEESIKNFMTFMLSSHANNKTGIKDALDEIVWDNVFEGSGWFKIYWQKEVHQFVEVEPVATTVEKLVFDSENLTGRTSYDVTMSEQDVVKNETVETPQWRRILLEDVILPIGQSDPQIADFVSHRVFMNDYDLKAWAHTGKFDKEAVEEVLKHKRIFGSTSESSDEIKKLRLEMDGHSDPEGYFKDKHVVIERYGKIFVKKELDHDENQDINEVPQEAVVWVHQASGAVLGWTYLYRISPSGIRPIFKTDFIRFPDRSHGVGVAEVLAPIAQSVNAIYNLRQDNGILASTPFGFYRSASGLKADKWQIEPGQLIPVDDPNQDVRIVQMPFLQGFGYQEEDRLVGYAEKILTTGDLQLGLTPSKVGGMRTASGATAMMQESSVQLEIHYDRLARTMTRALQCMFALCRERVPSEFYYRLTGDLGEPIFGKVNRADLKGEYDFEIDVDVLAENRIEAQQQATMAMQTLINPAMMNTGVVSPSNLYHLAKNFLRKNRVRRIENYISEPQNYTGEVITPSERIFRIVVNNFNNPPIESTVRLEENHGKAIAIYEGFKQSPELGLLTSKEQLVALQTLIERHQQLMAAQQSGGNPNMSGMQIPREGFIPGGPQQPGAGMEGNLMPPEVGGANGPVV